MEKRSFTFEEIKLKMARYCAYQDRCHKEVEQKMKEFLLIPEAKDEILLFLIRENYLNEERFVRSYIRGKFNIKKWGRNKIKSHLKGKGITEKLILKCFDEIDYEDYYNTIKALYEKYYTKQTSGSSFDKKQKTIRYLIGKGYEYDAVLDSISEL
ncbi:regulatory protein RecX [Riemerella columbipharyngis]|uniref:Regulatory protein RecX n=1 Tax=Riemerella columbipharyngis TaxID=1071918 RepID=A0A1G7CWH8_9FLAO|nr:regulatory protein RecX [Riemerella columbipharyngis]SDE43593.1 regulatory protein [Riemerella columbipharyngis]